MNKVTFKERIFNLLCIKSIVTICLTGVFCYLGIIGKITPEVFAGSFTTVIAFYFGTQQSKTLKEEDKDNGSSE